MCVQEKQRNNFKLFLVSCIYTCVRPLLNLFAAVFLSIAALSAEAATTTQARLILSAETARPGDTVMAGVHLKMAPRWHTYWKNPGGPGIPTSIAWQLPRGISAGEIQWPLPEKLTVSNETSYVYLDEAVLLVPLKLAPDLKSGPLEFKAKVSWLECEIACVLGNANVATKLEIGDESKPSPDTELIETWKKKVPQTAPADFVKVSWERAATGDSRPLVIEWSNAQADKKTDFLPYADENFEVLPATEIVSVEPGKVRLRKMVKKSEGDWPKQIAGVLTMGEGESALAYEINSSVAPSGATKATSTMAVSSFGSLLQWLALAFLGGLILNIMPCVLPVIALKILGFVQQSKEAPQQVRKLGLIYALGVLFSFIVLAGMVIAVQQAGNNAGWGMQMQNPYFRFAMTIVVALVAMNLFGLFEITLGGRAMGLAGGLASKEGNAGAFFNGVLATALATPCTAPFLASALGFAFAQSPFIIVLMFLAIGAGLASPYVVLSWQPAWLKFLPKPGAWMEKFKIAMGFPMLATAIWLFDLTAPSFGESGALGLGLFLVVLALVAWIWGEFVQRGRKGKGLAVMICLLLLAVGYWFALEGEMNWRSPMRKSAQGSLKESPDGIDWQPWSAAAVEKARAEGKPILVDFTAKWCLTCKANKRTSIEIPSVRAKLKAINAVALRGDYTDEDEDITVELKKFDRAGVPLVLVYPKNPNAEPMLLPAFLTPCEVGGVGQSLVGRKKDEKKRGGKRITRTRSKLVTPDRET